MSVFARASRSYLPDRDYLPVAMPTTDVHVLQVLAQDGGVLRRYSTLGKVLRNVPDAVLPVIKPDEKVVDVNGRVTRSTKIGLGLSVVSEILRVLGAGGAVNLAVSRAHTVEYNYADVIADSVDLVELDRWLGTADFDPSARSTAELLAAEHLYVVVAALKARALTVRILDDQDNTLDLDVPAVQGVAGGNLAISTAGQRSSTVTFRGDTALGVAVKATRIQVDEHGFYLDSRPRTKGEVRGLGGSDLKPIWLTGDELRLASA